MKLLIKGATVVNPVQQTMKVQDVLVVDGKIAQIGERLAVPQDAEVYPADGLVLAPGLVDLHAHLREPGYEYKETIASGARSAAAGGFTTVCCMANTHPVNDIGAITQFILEKAKEADVRVLPIGAISKGLKGEGLAEIGELKESGCIAISDDGKTIMDSQLMRYAMEYAKDFDLPVITHCIDAHLAAQGCMHEGIVSCKLGVKGISSAAEDIIIARDIQLAKLTGARLHVAHVSTQGGVELVRQAKQQGVAVTAEVTPHHLTLTDEACSHYDTHTKMCPPLRTQSDIDALIAGLADGTIDAIATDHAPHAIVDKEVEFERAAMGVIGFETAFSLAMRLVESKKLTFIELIQKLSYQPHRLVMPQELYFETGARADLILIDLQKIWEYDVTKSYSKSRNSPFHGWQLKGKVMATMVAGKWVYG
ncbi:MAG: dihydroorotase [Deltaproteobacteria bacterium]|nr:dihydroorotase [Deltaproteobacteria bacterium]